MLRVFLLKRKETVDKTPWGCMLQCVVVAKNVTEARKIAAKGRWKDKETWLKASKSWVIKLPLKDSGMIVFEIKE